MKGENTGKKQSINDLWGNSKQSNALMIVVLEVEETGTKGNHLKQWWPKMHEFNENYKSIYKEAEQSPKRIKQVKEYHDTS